jgi:endoglucanase
MSFRIRRGTNISHWLSQTKQRAAASFTETDARRLKGWGFDHVRLPVDEVHLWTEAGYPDAGGFRVLDAALDWCADAGLRAVVDLHILRSHYFMQEDNPPLFANPREAAKFVELWLELSHRLQARPTGMVAYELLNEAVARNHADWNRVASAAFTALREVEPARTIVLGSNWFNVPENFDRLWIPDDPHTILTFHFYKPMLVTHYQASWTDTPLYNGRVQYPGKVALDPVPAAIAKYDVEYDRAAMVRDIAWPLAKRKETGHALYCGEFGCLNKAPLAARQAWYRDILSVFAEHDIAWANWDYRGHFGLIAADGRESDIMPVMRESIGR